MNSHNHIMFGTVDIWFYKILAGINIDQTGPGFERFIIKPHVVGDLKNVSASIRTIKGLISSEWARSPGSITLKVTVPVNARAVVYVPKMGLKNVQVKEGPEVIWKNSMLIKTVEGITEGREEENYVIFDVGSGAYIFELTGEKKD